MIMLGRAAALIMAALIGSAATAAMHRDHEPPPILTSIDVSFAQDMSAHHQQAAMMSDMLATTAAPDVRALADQIRFTQLNEIGQLTAWLQLADAPSSSPEPMAWMHPGGTHHPTTGAMTAMPGIASPSDLQQLQRATGDDNETLFLQLMTRHHQGGIEMASYVLRHTSTDVVRRVAAVMIDEQIQELHVMIILLAQRGDTPLAYP